MNDMCMKNKKGKRSLKSEILLGRLALAVIIGLGTAAYAASPKNSDKSLSGETFDPFTLQSTRVSVAQSESKLVEPIKALLLPPVRIPFRPPLRSLFRPPLVLR